ncbi:MAG TPA: hypothetical protein VM621_06780 [Luteibacter sp.]|uniref:hypothetical protein n=1 Tax=Luteibacter sp. TaxID=1886636 RepID=UPI002B6F0E06|nr:hypothetical protein [Luteibacter sp.]HVI54741.1 hypothetical protein [Luteibacter sp.]
MFKIVFSLFSLPAAVGTAVRDVLPARVPARSDGLRRSGLHCVWRRDASSGQLRSYWSGSD